MSDLNVALILRFIDQATGPARAALRNIQGAAERMERFGAAQVAAGRAMQQQAVANVAALRGEALAVAGVGYAVYAAMRPAMQFEQAMARVGAVSRASAEDQALLTRAARDLGATTSFSARQAAEGMQYLAMAGFDVNETIAAMPGLLNLAAAAGSDLGRTSDIASNVLSGFAMRADEMGRLGDVMTNTFTTSNTTLESLGATMSYVAPAAAAAGVALETTAAMAGLLGNYGIQGERAGTALRAVLSRLAAPSTEAAAALERLNVQVSDEGGNLRDIPTVLAEMDRAMAGMGSATRTELLTAIFGLEAATAAQVLMTEAGTGALDRYADTLRETGTAATVAERMNDTAQGAMRRLASATEEAQIALGNGLLPVLADLAERLIPIITAAGQWIEANQGLVTSAGYVVAALLAISAATLAARLGFWLLFGWVGRARAALGLLMQFGGGFTLAAISGAFAELRRLAGRDVTQLADTVAAQSARMQASLARVRTAALTGAMALAYNVMRAPTDPEGIREFASQNAQEMGAAFRSAPGISHMMGLYDRMFEGVHGRAAPVAPQMLDGAATQNAAATVQSYAGRTDLPTAERLDGLRELAGAIRAEVAALEDQLAALPAPADAYDLGSPAYQQISRLLANQRGDLATIEAELARGEAEAATLTEALRVLGDTSVTPEINVESIERAYQRVQALAGQMRALESGARVAAGGDQVAGARATGGAVRALGWYRINEQGEELFAPAMAGRIIPHGETRRLMAGGGGAAAGGTLQIGDIHIHTQPGQDAAQVAREVRRQIADLMREARFALHDGGLHA